jgi:hypothetical protein
MALALLEEDRQHWAAVKQARSIAISSRARDLACRRLQGKQVDARFSGQLFPASLILRAPLF